MDLLTQLVAWARKGCGLLVLCVMAACASPSGYAPPSDGGVYGAKSPLPVSLPLGGALRYDNDEVWKRLVALAGGPGSRFVVLATASSQPERTSASIADALQRYGAMATIIPVAPLWQGANLAQELRNPHWIDAVKGATGAFFSGGAQERIVDTLMPEGIDTPLLAAIRELHQRGGVVAGTSAGAAIMSTVMFRDPPDVMTILKGNMRQGKEIDRGLGFVGADLFVDQHFLKRGRVGRMIPLMVAKGYTLGVGVGENSGAIVSGDEIEIIGGRGALVVDLAHARTDSAVDAFNISGARLHYLDHGDRFHLPSRTVKPAVYKVRDVIDPNASDFKPYFTHDAFYLDILGDNAIANAMAHLIDGVKSELLGLAFRQRSPADDTRPDLGFEFRLYRDEKSRGWYTGRTGGEDYTVSNAVLDITPVRVAQPLYGPWQPK